MGGIFRFHDDHGETERLLPWYATARIDPRDRATVEAHLAQCQRCRASLATERRLRGEVAGLSPHATVDWMALRQRLTDVPRTADGRHRAIARLWQRSVRSGRTIAAPVLAAAAAAAVVLSVTLPTGFDEPASTPRYRTLGSASSTPAGNLIVTFRPDASEARLRAALQESGARLVDGPTSADAYVLRVPDARRGAALARLRAHPVVTMAEPIDAAAP